jgi:predicted amidohydrolase
VTFQPQPDQFGPFSPRDLERYPSDPAHLFMVLHDLLSDGPFLDRQAAKWVADREVRRRVARVEESVLAAGRADPDSLRSIVEWDGERGLFTLLLGLDAALWYVNPFNPVMMRGGLDWLATRYAETGRLNVEAEVPGALLPRCAFPGEPRGREHKADFFAVHRVPAEHLAHTVRYSRLESRYDPAFHPEEPVKVACAPFLSSFDELGVTFTGSGRTAAYRIAPKPSTGGDHMRTRIEALLSKMDKSGARIGVLPEGCLSDALAHQWRTIAHETADPDKPLRWLLLGSGPVEGGDPPHNRAILIDRWTGHTLLTHDKLERFTVDATQLDGWHVPDAPKVRRVKEDIRTGATVAVRDSSFGRLAVLICQDLYASQRWERELVAIGVSHLLVPIFSKPILRYRWEQQAAERQVLANLGAWVVVSNSLAVASAMASAIPPDLPAEEWYTCLVIGPEDANRTRYGFHIQLGRADDAADLGWVSTNGERRRLPAVLAGGVRPSWFDHRPIPRQRRSPRPPQSPRPNRVPRPHRPDR